METDYINILETDLLLAQEICAPISDLEKRNRAVANVIGAKVAFAYFNTNEYEIDTSTGLHNIAPLTGDFELSDIYVNGSYIDVRLYFSDDEMNVPKVHFETGILPAAYMFIKLSQDMKTAEVTGFIHPERIDKTKEVGDAYYVSKDNLESFYDIEYKFQSPQDVNYEDDEKIYEYIEGSLSKEETIQLFTNLIKSRSARKKLIKTVKAQSVLNLVSISKNAEQNITKEQNSTEVEITEEDLDDLFIQDDTEKSHFYTEVTPSGADVIESLDNEQTLDKVNEENEENIEQLFTGEQEGVPIAKKKNGIGGFLLLILIILSLGAGAYWWYSNVYVANQNNNIEEQYQNQVQDDSELPVQQSGEAMPVETIGNNQSNGLSDTNSASVVPAIEQSIDASILVSNLRIDWEVPSGYVSNTSAKKYLIKLGKIIQLNLKTELLLLQKPPLANKITVELKYNPQQEKFNIVGIKDSSGEKTVDDTILKTVEEVLKLSISQNMTAFSKLQGNPILVIHL